MPATSRPICSVLRFSATGATAGVGITGTAIGIGAEMPPTISTSSGGASCATASAVIPRSPAAKPAQTNLRILNPLTRAVCSSC
jgi:hypothetical protein